MCDSFFLILIVSVLSVLRDESTRDVSFEVAPSSTVISMRKKVSKIEGHGQSRHFAHVA